MSYFTIGRLEKGLELVKPYVSKAYNTQIFFEESSVSIYLSKGKTLSHRVIAQLESCGWCYNEEAHKLHFELPDLTEMLTHDNKYLRDQANRHLKWKNGHSTSKSG